MSVAPGSEPFSPAVIEESRGGPTAVRLLLGSHLRRFREAAGVSPDRAGYEIRGSRSKISRMEHGRVGFKERDVCDLLTLYGVSDAPVRAEMLSLVQQANAPGWWAKHSDVLPDWFESYLGLEAAASLIRTFELQFVHGLFQTEDYARAVMALGLRAPAEDVERRLSVRMTRQEMLTDADPPRIWSIVDEAALRRPIGDRQVMRDQLRRLIEVSELPNVTIQAVPFETGGHTAAGGSFTLLRFKEDDLSDLVYIEQLTSALYLEGCADIDHYMEVMNRLSAEALTPDATIGFFAGLIREL